MSFFAEVTGKTKEEWIASISVKEMTIVIGKIRAAKAKKQNFCELKKNNAIFMWLQSEGFVIYPKLCEVVEECRSCRYGDWDYSQCERGGKCPEITYHQTWICCWPSQINASASK